MPKKSIVKKSDCKQISNPQKNFLIAAICVYIVILAMSFCGHYHMCGQNGDGSQQGGLWNVCNTLGCIFIMNQVIIDIEILGVPPEEEYGYIDFDDDDEKNATDYYGRIPSDYMLLKASRFGLLASHLFGTGLIVSMGLRIGLFFKGTVALALLVSQAACHYICIMMAALVMHIAIVGLYEEVKWVVYVMIATFALTNVAIWIPFIPLIKEHLEEHEVIEKKD